MYVYTVYRYFLTGFLDVLLTLGGCQVVIVRSERIVILKRLSQWVSSRLAGNITMEKKNIFEVSELGPPKFKIQTEFSYTTFRFTSSILKHEHTGFLKISKVVKGLVYCRVIFTRRSKSCWAVLIPWQLLDAWRKLSSSCPGHPTDTATGCGGWDLKSLSVYCMLHTSLFCLVFWDVGCIFGV